MKKIIIVLALAVLTSIAASAQPRTIGGRITYGVEATYQHSLGNNFVEANLGFGCFSGLNLASTYNFMLCKPDWTPKGTWGVYAGPGATLQFDFNQNGSFDFGVGGQVGLEYFFEQLPLQLSFDWRPMFGPQCYYNGGAAFWAAGVYNFGLAARYYF